MGHMVQKRNIDLEIIESLLKKESHIRGIAKKLNESHSTIFRWLNQLKTENIVDSRIEGRNKVFFLKKNILARNYVLKAEVNKTMKLLGKYSALSIIFEEILNKTNEKLIVLFGSYAKGLAKTDSDIDIYIETTSRNVKVLVEGIHSRINVKMGSFNIRSPLIKEIIKDHVIIRGFEVFYEQLPEQT